MRRIRNHLTYANVLVTILAFIVLAGGTALGATYVVSSNSEVGPDTISGHNPPLGSGDQPNIIPHSIGVLDVRTGRLQRRVTGTCDSGRAISSIASDGTVGCADQNTNLWARAQFYLGGTIQSQTGNGTVQYAGSTGHYLVTFPRSVVDCAAVATANEGANSGWVALYETANIAKDPGGDPNTLAVSLMDARNGGFVNGYGFNIIVNC